ncbi:DNA recombination protein RmuC [Mergibacter septicus]|uniref:DNA recombination protein RmuC n=1 Tax=Mergibacter septicus TaxID=221402 RepID=UPI00117953D6|nr:DNA recombination protein RmuC [Mergibacter septicus]AWX14480.1 DNA recombination protein RmuC [Mergibacter septicus]
MSSSVFYFLIVVLLAIIILLFFIAEKHKREVVETQVNLTKNIDDYNQLVNKVEQLSQLKQQAEQDKVKAETRLEGMLTQLNQSQQTLQEKEQHLNQLFTKITDLSQQLTELRTTQNEREKHFAELHQQSEQNKAQLALEFQNLANRIFDEKSKGFINTSQSSLDTLLKPFREQIEGFQKRVNEVHSETLKGNATLEAELKKVLEIGLNISQEANNLASALKGNKKISGNWGEVQLERTLQTAGLVEGDHYISQFKAKDQEGKLRYPDFVLKLPDDKHLILDSKVSLVAYEKAIVAEQESDINLHLNEHVAAIRQHISDLSSKNYSDLIGIKSPDFVLMFVPIEPAYIEALRHDPSLFNFGYEKSVILVSHTTLMPILRTVANLWRIEQGNAQVREISERAGEIYNQVCVVAERLMKLGNSLNTVSGHYNSTVVAMVGQQGLHGKVERFKALSTKANKSLPHIDLLQSDIENSRLLPLVDQN